MLTTFWYVLILMWIYGFFRMVTSMHANSFIYLIYSCLNIFIQCQPNVWLDLIILSLFVFIFFHSLVLHSRNYMIGPPILLVNVGIHKTIYHLSSSCFLDVLYHCYLISTLGFNYLGWLCHVSMYHFFASKSICWIIWTLLFRPTNPLWAWRIPLKIYSLEPSWCVYQF